MQLLLLCDGQSQDFCGCNLGEAAAEAAQKVGFETKRLLLDFDHIQPCVGCFDCWVKTPGLCIQTKDNANSICRDFARSDAVLLLSKVTYGSHSPDVKAMLDRIIPNALPFFETVEGEMHHPKRYAKVPNWIAFGYGNMTDEEADTFAALTVRNSLHFHPPKRCTLLTRSAADLPQALEGLQAFLKEEGTK